MWNQEYLHAKMKVQKGVLYKRGMEFAERSKYKNLCEKISCLIFYGSMQLLHDQPVVNDIRILIQYF